MPAGRGSGDGPRRRRRGAVGGPGVLDDMVLDDDESREEDRYESLSSGPTSDSA